VSDAWARNGTSGAEVAIEAVVRSRPRNLK
jgi:hypothetical protein